MPRGQYDRSAAAARRASDDTGLGDVAAIQQAPAPSRIRGGVDRDDDWANRTRRIKGSVDYYDMAKGLAPADAIYQWKLFSIYGQEQREKQIVFSENGWSAVPADRAGHQHLPSVGNIIVHEGLVLMEQPIALYREARQEEAAAHREQLRMGYEKVRETPSGQMDRTVGNVSARNEVMTIDRE